MNRLMRMIAVYSALLIAPVLSADGQRTLIFSDDFNRNESQEVSDEIGHGWGTNSKSRAGGNKQADLREGALHIYRHEIADHAVSVTHPAEFRNGSIELRFMLEHENDSLGLDVADLLLKEVHAGHLFVVRINVKQVEIVDLKTGGMNLAIRELKTQKKLSPAQQAQLATKEKYFPFKLETGTWHGLRVDITGDAVAVAIDGQEIGSFASEGFAHPTKRILRLAVPKNALVDDVKIYSIDPAP